MPLLLPKPKPKKTSPRSIARRRALGRKRFAEFKQRCRDAKKHHGDQVRFYEVPMRDSEILALVADLKLDRRADKQISDREWSLLVGRTIATAALTALKNRR